jgi:trehalose-phosphatase
VDPPGTAILTDIDGTLAPIVDDPGAAAVPDEAREALRALASRFGLVGCISGRQALEARRIVGIEGIAYAGNHGLELLLPEESEARPDPSLAGYEDASRRFLEREGAELEKLGIRTEDKGPIQALHWRQAPDGEGAEERLQGVANRAEEAGLATHWGRKVLELRPPGGADKGRAVAALLGGRFSAAAYAGDDRTDLDAFSRLRTLVADGSLRTALCVGVTSAEAPPGLEEQSDITVAGPPGWLELLTELA